MPVRLPSPMARLAALTIVAAATLAGCSGSDDDPAEPTATATTEESVAEEESPTPTATKSESTPTTVNWTVSDEELGVSFTAEAPEGWETGEARGVPVVRSAEPFEGFQANVYAQFQSLPAGTTIEQLSTSVAEDAASQTGWQSSQPDGIQVTIDGNPAFIISGKITEDSVGDLACSETVILYKGTSGPVAVYLVATTGPNDTDAQRAISDLLDSVTFNK